MAYSAMAVANALVKRAKDGQLRDLSPMKLQKLLFYVQSWHMARLGKPLIDDFFCRWQYGPVVPSLFHEFKEYGSAEVTTYGGHVVEEDGTLVKRRPIVGHDDICTWGLIDEVIAKYGAYSGPQLSAMTHEAGSAWQVSGPADGDPIPNATLAECIRNDRRFDAGVRN